MGLAISLDLGYTEEDICSYKKNRMMKLRYYHKIDKYKASYHSICYWILRFMTTKISIFIAIVLAVSTSMISLSI
jgi:hypothetical protein